MTHRAILAATRLSDALRSETRGLVAAGRVFLPLRSSHRFRVPLYVATVVILIAVFVEWAGPLADPSVRSSYLGRDFVLYRDATARWLAGGGFYLPRELAGPFIVQDGDILYPPTTLVLFAPFTLAPPIIWWIVPVSIVSWVIWRLRPDPVTWPLLAACLLYPNTGIKLLTGNPVLWIAAAVSLGVLWPGPAVLALLKPTLAPFAIWGVRRRSWWLWLALLTLCSAAFAPLWPQYLGILVHAQNPAGAAYSGGEVPLLAMPIIAWLGQRSRNVRRPSVQTRSGASG